MKTIEKIVDLATNKEIFVERDLTIDEISALEAFRKEASARIAEQMAKIAARKLLLDKLGITEEEATLLLS